MKKYGVEAVPLSHESMNVWRENFKGVEFFHKPTGLAISGAIDDIWVIVLWACGPVRTVGGEWALRSSLSAPARYDQS